VRILQREPRIEEFFEKKVIISDPEESFFDACRKIFVSKSKKIPVVRNKKLIGIYTVMDLIYSFNPSLKVREFMKRNLITIGLEENISRAISLMKVFNIGALLVTSGEYFKGIITERSILENIEKMNYSSDKKASDIMTPKPFVIKDDFSLWDAFQIMKNMKLKRFPVVDKDEKVVGIFHAEILLKHASLFNFSKEMMKNKRISEVVSSNYEVISGDETISEIIRKFLKDRYAVLVVDNSETLLGIITERDIIQKVL